MVDSLIEMQIAKKIIANVKYNENPIDTHYNRLKCDIKPLKVRICIFCLHSLKKKKKCRNQNPNPQIRKHLRNISL